MAVNSSSWKKFPLAPRETRFNADDAIARALDWSGMSASKFNSIFLWRNSNGEVGNRNNYRLPIADIIDGKPTLIPRAVFSAGVIMSGGHGGLEGVVDETEREEIKRVLTQIYDMLAEEYGDPRVVAPWLLGKTTEERDEAREDLGAAMWTVEGLMASVIRTGRDLPVADVDHPWDAEAAVKRVWDLSEGDFRQYRKAFLWHDASRAEQKNSYRLPVADVVDGQLKIVPRALKSVLAALDGHRSSLDVPDDDMDEIAQVLAAFPVRNFVQSDMDEDCGCDAEDQECGCGDEDVEALEASAAPVHPHSSDFEHKYPADPVQPFTVTADGRASGLLWMWNKCHAGIMDECVMAPRTATNYAYFHNGQVLTSDGKLVKVGKITMGTGHAGPNMRWMPAADHYDNTGTVAAIGRVTETAKGGWFDGVLVSSLSDEQAQELRRSPISGDWRRINGNLELVAALAVNTPGFPIVASINGESQSLVAAGMILKGDEVLASAEPDKTEVEKDLTAQVDELDAKLSDLALRDRARRWSKVMASVNERKK